jgi:hypothetical protein
MTALNRSTRRRLQKLQQVPSVWEGDRRCLPAALNTHSPVELLEHGGDCVLWVDGSQGMVRAMDIVPAEAGPEVIVRTLLQAMEYPQGAAKPARPQKVLVQDREIQFFLRGALQDLGITIDYVPELPLIEEIFRSLQDVVSIEPPQLPPQYEASLLEKAHQIWDDAPWELLGDHQIIAIQLNQWDIGTLYASVMGLLGMEYGILLYRSVDSLRQFRQQMLADKSLEQMEAAFLRQDCLFLTFEAGSDATNEDEDPDLANLPLSEIQPMFGNLHPMEGLRAFLHDEEAIAVLVALEALHRFFQRHRTRLTGEEFPVISSRYRIPIPQEDGSQQQVSVKVETLPDLADELLEMGDLTEEDSLDNLLAFPMQAPILRDDLFPQDAYFSLGMMPWSVVEQLRQTVKWYQSGEVTQAGDGLPIVLIQTSQPKAKALVEALQSAGGVEAIYFNPGEDPINGDRYDLGILKTNNGELHLFSEFFEDDPVHIKARQKWDQRSKKTKGWCGLVIARGLKGASRGNPQLKDLLGLFEVRSRSASDLNMGILQLLPQVD